MASLVKERFDPRDGSFAEQTRRHHIRRYEFAASFEGTSYLDICCGYGYGLGIIGDAHPEARLVGVDVDPGVVSRATSDNPRCTFRVIDVSHPFVLGETFNVVTCMEAIEHLPYHSGLALLGLVRYGLLQSGGTFVLSTPRDVQDKYNHFHKSVWTYPILKNELGSLFSDVTILGQDWETGIISSDDVVDNDFYVCVCR